MKSLRNRLRSAVFSTLPIAVVACSGKPTNPTPADTAGPTGNATTGGGTGSATTTTGGTTGTGACVNCASEGLVCDAAGTACVPACDGGSASVVETLTASPPDGGGNFTPQQCAALCPLDTDPGSYVISCEIGGLGCTNLTTCLGCLVCGGRAPEGLRWSHPPQPSPLAGFLAQSALLEASSVVAFERMATELEAFGAPKALVDRARAAALDEVRHAEVMGAHARRFGGAVPAVELTAPSSRSLEDFSAENIREGCVRETLGAAIATWQGQRAEDTAIRQAMSAIAEDEVNHAQLGWDVAEWASSHLDPRARERLEGVKRQAIASLVESTSQVEDSLQIAGVPTAAQTRRLIEALQREVWC